MAIELVPSKRIGTTTKSSRTNEIARALAKIHDIDDDEHLRLCVYARQKVGKTRFSCDSGLKTLLIDCRENGTASLRKMNRLDPKRIRVYPLSRWEDADPVYWLLKSGEHDFEVVVVDTVTSLAEICMRWVLKDSEDRDFTREPKTPDQRSWGRMGTMMGEFFAKMCNLPMHVIFTAQERITINEDEDGTVTKLYGPSLSPRPLNTLLSSVGTIGRLYVKETVNGDGKTVYERRMLLGPHDDYITGNRWDELNRIERNPTMGKFITKIYGDTNAS